MLVLLNQIKNKRVYVLKFTLLSFHNILQLNLKRITFLLFLPNQHILVEYNICIIIVNESLKQNVYSFKRKMY